MFINHHYHGAGSGCCLGSCLQVVVGLAMLFVFMALCGLLIR